MTYQERVVELATTPGLARYFSTISMSQRRSSYSRQERHREVSLREDGENRG